MCDLQDPLHDCGLDTFILNLGVMKTTIIFRLNSIHIIFKAKSS